MNSPDPAPARPLRILVVENHADTLKWLVRYLQLEGHHVSAARNVQEARAALAAETPEVLLSDIGLSDGDGWELMESQRAADGSFAFYGIAMSGLGMSEDHVKSQAAGYRHHILKPFNPSELKGHLQSAAQELAARG